MIQMIAVQGSLYSCEIHWNCMGIFLTFLFFSFYFFPFFKLILQFAISAGIITLCTMDNLFKYSDKSLVFIYFFTFGLSAIMLSFLISTFFARAKTAVAVGTLAFLGAFFPYYTINDEAVSMLVFMLGNQIDIFYPVLENNYILSAAGF